MTSLISSGGSTSDHLVVHVSFGKQVYRAISKELATNVLALTGRFKRQAATSLKFKIDFISLTISFISANLGGIYSLFVGFSAITFFELIYYFGVRFYLNYKNELISGKKLAKNRQLMLTVVKKLNAHRK